MKFRLTRQEAQAQKKYKPIDVVVMEQFGKSARLSFVLQYYVDFTKVRTKDLVKMLQVFSIHVRYADNEMESLKLPTPKAYDRIIYLKVLSEFCDVDFTDAELDELIRNKNFIRDKDEILRYLRKELSTREHIPNKKQGRILRRLKAQGKHIID
jgi:hypothetical protein